MVLTGRATTCQLCSVREKQTPQDTCNTNPFAKALIMSRRHKEIEEKRRFTPTVESQGDGHLEPTPKTTSASNNHHTTGRKMIQTVVKRDVRIIGFNEQKIMDAIRKAMTRIEDATLEIVLKDTTLSISSQNLPSTVTTKDLLTSIIDALSTVKDTLPEEYEKRRRGRPKVSRLFGWIEDSEVYHLARDICQQVLHKSLGVIKNIKQFLVTLMCALFRIDDTEEPYGKVSYFYSLFKGRIRLPHLRTIQNGYKWFREWSRSTIRTCKERAEEALHVSWENMEQKIFEALNLYKLQYAM